MDATVIQLLASCLDWARHNRRKAVAKCHLRLGLRNLLPGFVVIGSARESELYRCRWQIEAFFKQIKQTLQLADFLGQNANAVRWQVWTALLVYVLLRFQSWRSRWVHSFARLFTLLRAALWLRRDLAPLLRRYGTAPRDFALLGAPAQSWLPGFAL